MTPTRLRAELRPDALGVDAPEPRLSWLLPEGAGRQEAYELSVDGRVVAVEGAEHTLRPWPDAPLSSGESRAVRVRVRTDLGWSEWSEPLDVEAGLLSAADWVADWVSPAPLERGSVPRAGFRPAYRLRGEVVVDRPVRRARLHVTAHGVYEPWLDGRRVSDDELTPGYTEYLQRTQVQTYDVTAQLTVGRHVLGSVLADGWFRGQVGLTRAHDQWGDTTAFLAQLVLDHEDGTRTVVGTGGDWRCATSHILAADLIEGQQEDRRLVEPDWCTPSYDDSGWSSVDVVDRGHDILTGTPAPPARPVESLRPVSVRRLREGVDVVDFGQNINGRVRLTALGPAGTRLTLTHGEALGADGDVTLAHLVPNTPFLPEPLSAGQVDVVVSAGVAGDAFEPRFTTHGFQYVRVEGLPEPLACGDITAVVVHTDLEPRGAFSCSDERLDRLHDAAVWSFRGNACDLPTDCPTRERAGWTGDWQLYVPTASYLYDVDGFSLKWLRDVAVDQWDDGVVASMAPIPPVEMQGLLHEVNGSAGWGDAVVLVPLELYREYGDVGVVRELWPVIVRWLDRVEQMARKDRHPDRAARHPEPRPHDDYLWDTGFHWGEWLEPGEEPTDFMAFIKADKSEVATAFYAWSTRQAAYLASVLGLDADAERYADLSRRVAAAWATEFVEDGHVVPRTQANLVRALAFGLLPEDLRRQAADDLADLVRASGVRVGTGFLATPDLLPVLADHGHLDLAYELLLQESSPSWLAMIARGATTVWERWDGIDDDGVPHESLNHYSKGAVISFLHRYVAGLQRLEPTWRRFRVEPRPGGGLTSASTSHLSPHGTVAVSWTTTDGSLSLNVTVPPGCVAEVVTPDGTVEVGPGSHVL
ncbi:glycoside hydrolase family 78 protein [Nocardioides panacihumi]|uniref:alpha-L-rhamnosidase n=1 Tax=Nocardioides panacihumi TaxID=400774 RepID=A0ABN2Q9M8_9ACTN